MKTVVVYLIRGYRGFSWLLRNIGVPMGSCKYEPTCSEYAIESVEKYGVVKGLRMGIARIIRCHPYSKGGWDPVK